MDEATEKAIASLNAASNYASNAAYFLEHRAELLADPSMSWTPSSIDEHIGSLVYFAQSLLDDAKDKLPAPTPAPAADSAEL